MSKKKTGADLHFGHKFMARLRVEQGKFPYAGDMAPFIVEDKADPIIWKAVKLMDEIMIAEWNRSVGKNDEVHFVGDFSFYDEETTKAIFRRLNGRKHAFRGNHDPNWFDRLGWESVRDFGRVRNDGQSFWIMHYPMLTWPNAHKGTYHLHGHTHGNLRAPESTRMDVGVDCTGQVLISLDECKEILDQREYDFIDHHN